MKPLRWLEIIVIFTALTLLSAYLIPAESTLVFLRYVFSVIFLFIIPGNCLINILFRKKNKLDLIEESVLSVALSFGIAGITGLFLGLTPIGLSFITVTTALVSITLILAITAFILKNKDLKHAEQQVNNTTA
ncbi:MAG: DUF1616 domain-containing protein [Nitrososphaerota archaeon]|jgi:uncharacterized membrane protein|nr:DUF1616 domain-containing protein [Nitrososphaerota archaeon]